MISIFTYVQWFTVAYIEALKYRVTIKIRNIGLTYVRVVPMMGIIPVLFVRRGSILLTIVATT